MAWAETEKPQEAGKQGIREHLRMRLPEFHPVLAVIDMQNGFCTAHGSYAQFGVDVSPYRAIIPNVRRLIDLCHELGIAVFYTQQVREASGIDLLSRRHRIIPSRRLEFDEKIPSCVRGTWDAEIIEELAPTDRDHVVMKRRDSAFQDTEFELWLRSIGADTIIYTGTDTCICVENSFREGFNKGYDVIVVDDAVASTWPELHQAALELVRGSFGLVLNTDQLIHLLGAAKRTTSAFRLSMKSLHFP